MLVCFSLVAASTPAFAKVTKAQRREAIAASILASVKLKDGDFKAAAVLYDGAYRVDPSETGYLYSAARARHKGGLFEGAEKNYIAYLALGKRVAPTSRARAEKHLAACRVQLAKLRRIQKEQAELERRRKELERQEEQARERRAAELAREKAAKERATALPRAVSPTVAGTVAKSGGGGSPLMRRMGFFAAGIGVVSLATGGILYSMSVSAEDKYNEDLNLPDGPPDITRQEATDAANAIASQRTAAAIAAAIGAVGLAGGLLILSSDETNVSLAPTGPGFIATARF